ncbi:MCE family protein [Williamsia maris]|uniref:Phospholipid/cholesterol/gamma-HCH transport system substrate-binding protein n=1 Tax=Williamsia maris TaxID=72806 RepID=A0ABT1HCW4_9NOCA|nr:MlaD family protein [Williamsia maris]MCP2175511.1 phospholipid/cholesterol/gamma-HCH transport system substrate-binding protein [Williamsia maris]
MRRIIKIQLSILSTISIVSITVMAVVYLQIPQTVGIGTMTMTAHMPSAGGVYERANVTYRGATVGIVTTIGLDDSGVVAKLRVDDNVRIPRAGLRVDVHSMSAIGEQYIDLVPTTTSRPYLRDGDNLPATSVTIPTQVGPLLTQANDLLASIPQGKLRSLIGTSFTSLVGTEDDLASLVDSIRSIADTANDHTGDIETTIRKLTAIVQPLADNRAPIAEWARQLASFTGVVKDRDANVRSILDQTPATTANAQQLLDGISPSIPLLLANLISVGQVGVTYNPGLEQILVLLPPLLAALQTTLNRGAKDGAATADFVSQIGAPPACTTGYMPASERRSPDQVSVIPTPPDQYCKIPQDAPIYARGARNLPCMEFPGRRAPTPELCRDPNGYQPKGPLPSSIDGSGQPDKQGLASAIAPADYDPSSGKYVGPDGSVYRSALLTPTDQNGGDSWHQLMTTQQN